MNQTTEHLRAEAVLAEAEYSRAKALAERARMSLGLMGMFDPKGMTARARQTANEATAAHKSAKLAWRRVAKSKLLTAHLASANIHPLTQLDYTI